MQVETAQCWSLNGAKRIPEQGETVAAAAPCGVSGPKQGEELSKR